MRELFERKLGAVILPAVRRFGLLLTLMGVVTLGCTGVVLAQSTESEPRQSAEEDAASAEDISSLEVGEPVPDRYIVVLKDEAARGGNETSSSAQESPAQVASNMTSDYDLEVKRTYKNALEGFAAEIPEEQVEEVRSDPRVEFVAKDTVAKKFAQTMPTGINRTDADDSLTANIDGVDERVDVDIAILDTGIYSHPDLNIAGGVDCSDDGYSNYYSDGDGHGTHVAGTAAAIDNSAGVVGVAPGARLWAVKVLDDTGSGAWSDVICGIEWVTGKNKDGDTSNDIEVANMSLGGPAYDNASGWYLADDEGCGSRNQFDADAVHLAICESVNGNNNYGNYPGATYAVAAGNSYDDAQWYYPAAFDEVITVSALADYNGLPGGGAPNACNQDEAVDDDFAWFSNYGADVDLAAPGVCITSTYKAVPQYTRYKKRRKWRWRVYWVPDYNTISGTSMASPHVAGAAALYKSKNSSATPSQVHTALTLAANTEAEGSGHTNIYNDHNEPLMLAHNY